MAVRVAIVTTEAGNVEGSQGIAVGQSAQAQTVTIHLPPTVEPPDNLRDSIKDIWKIVVSDQLERREKQAEHAALHRDVTRHLDRLEDLIRDLMHSIRLVRAVVAALTVADLVLFYELTVRMGWWR